MTQQEIIKELKAINERFAALCKELVPIIEGMGRYAGDTAEMYEDLLGRIQDLEDEVYPEGPPRSKRS